MSFLYRRAWEIKRPGKHDKWKDEGHHLHHRPTRRESTAPCQSACPTGPAVRKKPAAPHPNRMATSSRELVRGPVSRADRGGATNGLTEYRTTGQPTVRSVETRNVELARIRAKKLRHRLADLFGVVRVPFLEESVFDQLVGERVQRHLNSLQQDQVLLLAPPAFPDAGGRGPAGAGGGGCAVGGHNPPASSHVVGHA